MNVRHLVGFLIVATCLWSCDRAPKPVAKSDESGTSRTAEKPAAAQQPEEATPPPETPEQQRIAAEARQRAIEAAQQELAEKEKALDAKRAESKKTKDVVKRFSVDDHGTGKYDLAVTDAGLQARQLTPAQGEAAPQEPLDIWYGDFDRVSQIKDDLTIIVYGGRGLHVKLNSEEQCNDLVAAINAALAKWRGRYPEFVR